MARRNALALVTVAVISALFHGDFHSQVDIRGELILIHAGRMTPSFVEHGSPSIITRILMYIIGFVSEECLVREGNTCRES